MVLFYHQITENGEVTDSQDTVTMELEEVVETPPATPPVEYPGIRDMAYENRWALASNESNHKREIELANGIDDDWRSLVDYHKPSRLLGEFRRGGYRHLRDIE